MAQRNAPRAIHLRGWLDTRERIQQGLAADPYVSALFSRNADLQHLRAESTDVISAAITICCGTRYLVDQKPMPQTSYIISLAIGELMSPVLPDEMCLDNNAATTVFNNILTSLFASPNIYTRRYPIDDWLAQLAAAEEEDVEEGDDAAAAPGQAADGPIADLRVVINEGRYEDIPFESKIDYLIWLSVHLQPAQYLKTVALIVTSYVGVAKRGTISEKFVDKVQVGMEADLGVGIILSSDIIRQAYSMFGRYVTSGNAAAVFERWLQDIPEHALRLRLSLSQVTGSGLTAFVIIGRAINKYRTFNWAKLNLLTGGELTCYKAALVTVGGNPYYGFNRDLGAARSTLYSSIAYVAKELLIQLNGETSLKNYKGWIRKPKSATVIEQMISSYIDERTRSMQEGGAGGEDIALFDEITDGIMQEGNVNLFA